MYERHWKLSGKPFENLNAERFYYPASGHQTALLKLRYAIEHQRAAAVLCGETGMGKTLLAEALMRQLPKATMPVTHVTFPQLPGQELLAYITDRLTGTVADGGSPRQLLHRFERFLNENVDHKQHALVVVDEAHVMANPDQLETLRLLLNLRPNGQTSESSWTLLLMGDPALLNLVERNRALDERIAVKCVLPRLVPEETIGYVQHRLKAVGGNCDRIFSADALEVLHLRSAGIPRRINRLADLALMVGFAEDLGQIDSPQIDSVYQELLTVAS
jgi:general secretion pathway protein A